MMYRFRFLMIAGFVIAPVWGQPRQWVDDFQTAATYDSASLYGPCFTYGTPSTKYTMIEVWSGSIYNERAVSGGGQLRVSNWSTANQVGVGRKELGVIGVVDMGQPCPDNPDPSPGAWLITSQPFTSDDVCVYGGFRIGASQSDVTWGVLLRASLNRLEWVSLDIEPDSAKPPEYNLDLFSLRETNGWERALESPDEIAPGFYVSNTDYNYAFCVSGNSYGAMLWTGIDMANPDETLGPVMPAYQNSASHYIVALMNEPPSTEAPGGDGFFKTVTGTITNAVHRGNSNFGDTFWVISGDAGQHYPSHSADLDNDRDVDGFDFLTFSNCYNGSNRAPLPGCANLQADLDRDGDTDGFDFLTFSNCYNGSNRKPLPSCFPPDLTPACEYGQVAKLLASGGAAGDAFGASTDLWSGIALIGAYGDGDNWTAESDQANADFGWSVSTAGDVNGDGYSDVIVGSYKFDNGQTDEGRAFVYLGGASGLSATANWTAECNQAGAYMGFAVSTAGDVNGDSYSDVIVGAHLFDNGQSDEGRASVYLGGPSGLSTAADWTAESNQASAYMGFAVSTAGDVNGDGYSDVIVGAWGLSNPQTNEGRAYVYYGSASGLSTVANWTAESDQAGALFGNSVATAGDVNGDGYSDVIVGAVYFDNGQTDEGRAYVYYGSASGLSPTPNWTAESDQAGAGFGTWVSTAGDVNGDGYSDVILGAAYLDNGQTDEGRVYVYYGSASGLSTTPNWTVEGNQASAAFGYSVSTAGDVNGDGYSDVIVGAYLYDNGESDEGRAYVYHGSASGLSATPNWTAEGGQVSADFGVSVSTGGDVNDDGYSDVIAGTPGYSSSEVDEGRALVCHGASGGLSDDNGTNSGSAYVFGYDGSSWQQRSKLVASDGAADDVFGCSVALGGSTVAVVGAKGDDDKGAQSGSAYVFRRSLEAPYAWQQEAKLLGSDGAAEDEFGYSVAVSGDVVIGAPGDDDKGLSSGSAYIFEYNGSNWSQRAKLLASDGAAYDSFGCSVGISSGVCVVGAYQDDELGSWAGSAYVFRQSGSNWVQEAKLLASDGKGGDRFGYSVAISGNVIVIGAPKYDETPEPGSAYVFRYNGSSWVQEAELGASDGVDMNEFGHSVDVSGERVVVGAWLSQTGAAYVFAYSGSSWVQEAKLSASDGAPLDFLGVSAISGDTVLVGAWGDDDLGNWAGSAYVFRCR